MNKKNVLLIALITIFASAIVPNTMYAQQTSHVENNNKPQWSNLCKSYATSLVFGGLTGSMTSILARHAANKAFKMFANPDPKLDNPGAFIVTFISILYAEYKLRNRLVDDVNESFKDNAIQHNKNLTGDAAWIASWIVFLVS